MALPLVPLAIGTVGALAGLGIGDITDKLFGSDGSSIVGMSPITAMALLAGVALVADIGGFTN